MTGITFPDLTTMTFAYDPLGRRISKTEGGVVTNFLYDGDRVYAEYDADWNLQGSARRKGRARAACYDHCSVARRARVV